MPKLTNQPKYVTIYHAAFPKNTTKNLERQTIHPSGHLYSANQSKGIIQRLMIRSHHGPVFQLPA